MCCKCVIIYVVCVVSVLYVCSMYCAHVLCVYLSPAKSLGGCVDTDKDELSLPDGVVDVCGEEQVLSPALLHYLV